MKIRVEELRWSDPNAQALFNRLRERIATEADTLAAKLVRVGDDASARDRLLGDHWLSIKPLIDQMTRLSDECAVGVVVVDILDKPRGSPPDLGSH